jgi:hypothetical protein
VILRLRSRNTKIIDNAINILDEYARDHHKLTLRQLYYQLVARGFIDNKVKEYANLSTLIKKGRMAGVIDWKLIEDRLRVPKIPYWVSGVDEAIQDAIDHYRIDRQYNQDVYTEVWIEKDALSGIVGRVTNHYHIRLVVNRGYVSTSAIHNAFYRFADAIMEEKRIKLLYLGDFDPSGLDMLRDISERLDVFFQGSCDYEYGYVNFNYMDGPHKDNYLDIIHLGLNKKQIKELDPPPNPAKITDPRAKWYIEKHGNISWEVDAMPPEYLADVIESSIKECINLELFEEALKEEKEQIAELETILENK